MSDIIRQFGYGLPGVGLGVYGGKFGSPGLYGGYGVGFGPGFGVIGGLGSYGPGFGVGYGCLGGGYPFIGYGSYGFGFYGY